MPNRWIARAGALARADAGRGHHQPLPPGHAILPARSCRCWRSKDADKSSHISDRARHQENLDHPNWRSPAPSLAGWDFAREIRSAWLMAIYFPRPPKSRVQGKLVPQTTNVRTVRHRTALSSLDSNLQLPDFEVRL